VKGICIIPILIADKLESRCLLTIVFVKEVDSFISVACYPDYTMVFHCQNSSTHMLLEQWSNTVDKVKLWTFLSNEYKTCAKIRQID
jgi:hypothetical protein